MMPHVGLLTFTFILFSVYSIRVDARFSSRRTFAERGDTTGLSSASWIWASNLDGSANASAGNVAFLKKIPTPSGKTEVNATIAMTAVDGFTLWVNGHAIGASEAVQDGWKSPQVLTVSPLQATGNSYSVLVENSANSAQPAPGLLASIQVTYSDGTSSSFPSDSSWFASRDISSDFPTPANLAPFNAVTVVAPYGSGPWGQSVTLPAADPSPLSLSGSTWIWSVAGANATAAAGSVGFRKKFPTPNGKTAQEATILMTADNYFDLYLNDAYIGSPPNYGTADMGPVNGWQFAQQFTVKLNQSVNNFTVIAQNYPWNETTLNTSAGLIAAIRVVYADGTSDLINSDSSWQCNTTAFASLASFLTTPDAFLEPSFQQGPLGIGPWENITSISNGLAFSLIPTPPFTSIRTSTGTSVSTPSIGTSQGTTPIPIAAIVAPVVGVLAVLLAVLVLFLRRRRRRNGAQPQADGVLADDELKPLTNVTPFALSAPTYDSEPYTYTGGGSSKRHGSRPQSASPPPPAAPPRRGKLSVASVMRMNGNLNDAEVPPPSYGFSI